MSEPIKIEGGTIAYFMFEDEIEKYEELGIRIRRVRKE